MSRNAFILVKNTQATKQGLDRMIKSIYVHSLCDSILIYKRQETLIHENTEGVGNRGKSPTPKKQSRQI